MKPCYSHVRALMPGTASGWMPYVTALQASGASVDSFAAHDDSSGFAPLCGDDLRRRPSARLWRVFSNQYFLPLLLLAFLTLAVLSHTAR